MLSPILFLIFALWVFWHSYKMLVELVGPRNAEEPARSRRFYSVFINIGGLLMWFSVGVAALSISIMKFTNKAILLLQ